MSVKLKTRDGIYYICGTIGGRRIRKSLGTGDKKSAEHLKAQAEARLLRAEVYGAEAETTFADAYNLYHPTGGDSRGYLAPILRKIGKLRLAEIKPARIKALARELYPGRKPQTWNRYVIVPVSAVINHAHEHGLCHPIRFKRFKPKDQRKRIAVTREWIDRFRTAALDLYGEGHNALGARLAAYALFMFTTAARPSEAIALRPSNFDLANLTGTSEPTKTGNRRTFYLTQEVAAELAALPLRQLPWGRNKGRLRVFGWADCKGPIEPWKAVCKHAGLDYREPYEAGRHSFATEAVTRQERNVITSAKVGNWKDPSVMLKSYAHAEKPEEFAEQVFGTKLAHPTKPKTELTKENKDL